LNVVECGLIANCNAKVHLRRGGFWNRPPQGALLRFNRDPVDFPRKQGAFLPLKFALQQKNRQTAVLS
jgi:hypothetical protein